MEPTQLAAVRRRETESCCRQEGRREKSEPGSQTNTSSTCST